MRIKIIEGNTYKIVNDEGFEYMVYSASESEDGVHGLYIAGEPFHRIWDGLWRWHQISEIIHIG